MPTIDSRAAMKLQLGKQPPGRKRLFLSSGLRICPRNRTPTTKRAAGNSRGPKSQNKVVLPFDPLRKTVKRNSRWGCNTGRPSG